MNQTEFIFETFDEANEVHKKLFEISREKGYITCADLFSMILKDEESIETINSIDIYHTHGWINAWDFKVEPIENSINGDWILKTPSPKILK